jgi:hypothetical protein
VHAELRANLKHAQEAYKKKFDRRAKPAPLSKVGDLVTKRRSPKFDYKQFGLFKIRRVVKDNEMAFELE